MRTCILIETKIEADFFPLHGSSKKRKLSPVVCKICVFSAVYLGRFVWFTLLPKIGDNSGSSILCCFARVLCNLLGAGLYKE